MNTRENKYSNNVGMSRVAKNDDLYKQINNSELDNFNVRSNATVIGNQEREIDVEQIKKILDKRYNSAPKRRSIRIEERPHENIISDEPTKEYDLTKVLEKAKDEKVETYEENRAKKLRNTQYNILSNLNIDGEEQEEVKTTPEENLMNLINTITRWIQMKKILLTLSIFLMIFISPNTRAIEDYSLYKESVYVLKYNTLNSKDLPSLLKDTNSLVLEIDANIKGKTYTYRILSSDISVTTEKLIKKITKDITDKETITDIEINGVKITKLTLKITNEDYNILKERSKIYEWFKKVQYIYIHNKLC